MKTLDTLTFILVVAGALNWLLVGLFRFDLVAAIAGARYGEVAPFNAFVYVLVGLAGLYQIFARLTRRSELVRHDRPTRLSPR